MEECFANVQYHVSDIYVADYTQFATEHPDQAQRGVTVCGEKPELINSVHFRNPNGVRVLSVNFEKNRALFKLQVGQQVSSCECMLVSEQGNQKRWLALETVEIHKIGIS